MGKFVTALITSVLMILSGPTACDQKKYDVPAGSAGGDSAGDNQPAQKCQPGQVQINPVSYQEAAPEVYQYSIFVELEDEDCGAIPLKNKMSVERDGTHSRPVVHMVWDDGKSGKVNVQSPYHTTGIMQKSIPHSIGVVANVVVTIEMLDAGVTWFTCRIERDAKLVTGLGQIGLARVAVNGIGLHQVHCRVSA